MSYILDALKKSEAERNRGNLPTLLTVPNVGLLKSSAAIWALLAALIINAALVAAWLYRPMEKSSQQQTAVVAPAPLATPAPIAAPDTSTSSITPVDTPTPSTARADPPTPTIAPPVIETGSAADIEDAARAPNPEPPPGQFAFSTHVYADDPTLRAVTLNGRRFVEGDTISAGVQLKQITETGVVLDIDGRAVAMDVLQDWR